MNNTNTTRECRKTARDCAKNTSQKRPSSGEMKSASQPAQEVFFDVTASRARATKPDASELRGGRSQSPAGAKPRAPHRRNSFLARAVDTARVGSRAAPVKQATSCRSSGAGAAIRHRNRSGDGGTGRDRQPARERRADCSQSQSDPMQRPNFSHHFPR